MSSVCCHRFGSVVFGSGFGFGLVKRQQQRCYGQVYVCVCALLLLLIFIIVDIDDRKMGVVVAMLLAFGTQWPYH